MNAAHSSAQNPKRLGICCKEKSPLTDQTKTCKGAIPRPAQRAQQRPQARECAIVGQPVGQTESKNTPGNGFSVSEVSLKFVIVPQLLQESLSKNLTKRYSIVQSCCRVTGPLSIKSPWALPARIPCSRAHSTPSLWAGAGMLSIFVSSS